MVLWCVFANESPLLRIQSPAVFWFAEHPPAPSPHSSPYSYFFGFCSHIGWVTKAALVKFNKQYGKAMGCLPSYLGRQRRGFEGFGMGRSKDETRVAMWTLERQGRQKSLYKHTILAFSLLDFDVFCDGLNAIFSGRIKILSALSVNFSPSIKDNLFVFQFLKVLVHHYNWFWPFCVPFI